MATTTMGRVAYKNRGAYNPLTTYVKHDVVLYQNGSYAYSSDTPAAGNLPTNTTYWDVMLDPTAMNTAVGLITYMHMKYSEDNPSSNAEMSDTPGDWLGIYIGSSSTAPTAYTSYVWHNITGVYIGNDAPSGTEKLWIDTNDTDLMADYQAVLKFKDDLGVWRSIPAIQGPSAYDQAVIGGYTGTLADFYIALNEVNATADAKTAAELAETNAESAASAAAASALQLASGVASPSGTYANLAALIAANPDHAKTYITLDDGKWCYHNGTAFVAGAVYQATYPASGSLDESRMYGTVKSKNLYNSTAALVNKNLNQTNGGITTVSNYTTSDFIPIAAATNYVFNSTFGTAQVNVVFYNAAKAYISGTRYNTGLTDAYVTSPGNAAFIRFSSTAANMSSSLQIEAGTSATAYEAYYCYMNWFIDNRDSAFPNDPMLWVFYTASTKTFIFLQQCKYGLGNYYLGVKFFRETDVGTNADMWCLSNVGVYLKSGTTFTNVVGRVVQNGEWTCAIKEDGAADFVGGRTHGDELYSNAVIMVDGKAVDLTANLTVPCQEVEILITSVLNRCATPAENIANHSTHIIISAKDIITEQVIEFLDDMTLDISYMTMLSVTRNLGATVSTEDVTGLPYVTNEGFKNGDFEVLDLSFGHTNNAHDAGVSTVSLYNDGAGHQFRVRIDILESNELASAAMFFDNSPVYNKIYFGYCGDNYAVTTGTVWRNKARYTMNYSGLTA